MAVAPLAEFDLHSLVDGHIEADRRADLLRRLAASPADRALVGSWQDQSDLIRDAFREVPHERLPVALDLAPPRLRSVDSDPLRPLRPTGTPVPSWRQSGAAALTAALLITIGLAISWIAGSRDADVADAAPPPAAASVAVTPVADTDATPTASLPSLRIPDLTASGLRLTGVTSEDGGPGTIVLRYRDDGTGRIAVNVARNAPGIGVAPIAQSGQSWIWRSRKAAFTLAGTLPPERLRALATTLQADQRTD